MVPVPSQEFRSGIGAPTPWFVIYTSFRRESAVAGRAPTNTLVTRPPKSNVPLAKSGELVPSSSVGDGTTLDLDLLVDERNFLGHVLGLYRLAEPDLAGADLPFADVQLLRGQDEPRLAGRRAATLGVEASLVPEVHVRPAARP